MIAGETRLEEYKTIFTTLVNVDKAIFINIHFEDGEIISFYDSVMGKFTEKQ